MVQAQAQFAQANAGQTVSIVAAHGVYGASLLGLRSLLRDVPAGSGSERRAALEAMARQAQEAATVRAREGWRGYALWRQGLSGQLLGLLTPQGKRYRMSKSLVSRQCWLWPTDYQAFLNALNRELRKAGSDVQVQSKHSYIAWYLRQAEKRKEAGVKAEGVCPICGGDLYRERLPVYVGGEGYVRPVRCWHNARSCNDWVTRELHRKGRLS